MKYTTLGNITETIRNGINTTQFDEPTDGRLPITRIETISDGTFNINRVKFVEVTSAQITKYSLEYGDILFSHINSPAHIGKTAIFDQHEKVIHGVNLLLLRVDHARVDPFYLNYYFKTSGARAYFFARCKRAVNQASLNQNDIKSLQIPLPPLDEQRRIAAILEEADHARRTRRYAQSVSDTFLQSIFVEVFGDPVTNPMEWEEATVAKLGNVQTGNTPSRDELDNYGDYIEWIKSDNLVDGLIYLTESQEMLSHKGFEKGRWVDKGSILVTCIAGSVKSIGSVALVDRKVTFNQQINSVTPFDDVHPLFLYGMFVFCKPLVQENATQSMKRIITKSKFEQLGMIKPPYEAQLEFAEVVEDYIRIHGEQHESDRQSEHLFQTLLDRAFRGEL